MYINYSLFDEATKIEEMSDVFLFWKEEKAEEEEKGEGDVQGEEEE